MFTRMPSPLLPLIVAVTTTKVSLATKFRIHRSFLLSCDWDVAWRSNLRACAQATKRAILQIYCSSDRGRAMVSVEGWGVLRWCFLLKGQKGGRGLGNYVDQQL